MQHMYLCAVYKQMGGKKELAIYLIVRFSVISMLNQLAILYIIYVLDQLNKDGF